MAIQIKINCACGQHYAFDVEPDQGRMPSDVTCPACGANGTAEANDIIARSFPMQPGVVAASVPRKRVFIATAAQQPANATASAQAAAAQDTAPPLAQLDFTRAINEARAKIFWGDTRQQAIVCLASHGIAHAEASTVVDGLMKARAATIRANGIRKIFVGIGLMLVPVVSLAIFLYFRVIPIKLFAITLAIGAWGAWMVIKGTFMTVAPKAETGDVANQ